MFHFGIPLVATLLHVYVAWRASSVPIIRQRVTRRWLFAIAGVLWAISIAGRLWGHGSHGPVAVAIELFGMSWIASLLLLAVALFAAEVLTGFGLILRRQAPALRGLALLAGLALSGVALVQGLRPPVVRHHEVKLSGLPARLDGTVIVAVSDLHLGSLLDARWLAARVDQILEQRPDLVIFLGDIFEGHGSIGSDMQAQLRRITAPLGVFAVTGNHEHYGRRRGGPGLEATGLEVLRDRRVEVSPGLILAGIDDLVRRRRRGRPIRPVIDTLLGGAPFGGLVFLSHAPLHAEQAASLGADLMLSGHTHGGQLWPLGYLVRLAYPFLGGRYEVKGMPLIVCRGTGTWGPRMRLWRPGEILRITLRSG